MAFIHLILVLGAARVQPIKRLRTKAIEHFGIDEKSFRACVVGEPPLTVCATAEYLILSIHE